MNWVDIVIILLCLIGCAIGIWKGFFKTFLSMISSSLVFLFSFLLCKPTATWLMKITTWDNSLCSKISHWLTGISPNFDINMVGMEAGELSSHINATLNSSGFPKFFRFLFKTTTSISPESIAHKDVFTMGNMISQTLTIITFILSCFIFFLIIFFVIKFLIAHFTKKFTEKSPTFKKVDKSVGGVFGLVRGLLWVFIIFAFISIFKNAAFFAPVNKAIQTSAIGKPLSTFIYKIIDKYFNLKNMLKLITAAF